MKTKQIWTKIKELWKNNQQKNSERYAKREELKEELEEDAKDIVAINKSPIGTMNDLPLKKAMLVQNLHAQRNLSKATDSLKIATWVLALATVILIWITIIDSPNSNYIFQKVSGIAEIIVSFLIILLTLTLVWKFLKFTYKKIKNRNS